MTHGNKVIFVDETIINEMKSDTLCDQSTRWKGAAAIPTEKAKITVMIHIPDLQEFGKAVDVRLDRDIIYEKVDIINDKLDDASVLVWLV
jgi:hypothetical protein